MALARYLFVILAACFAFGCAQRDARCDGLLRDAERIALGAAPRDEGHLVIELARAYRLKQRWVDLHRLWERAKEVLPEGSAARRRMLALVTGEDDGLIRLELPVPEGHGPDTPTLRPSPLPSPRPSPHVSRLCGAELWTDSALDELTSCAAHFAATGRLDEAMAALAEARAKLRAQPDDGTAAVLITVHLAILGPEAALQLIREVPWRDDAARDAAIVQLAYELVMGPGTLMPPAEWSRHADPRP